MDRKNEIALILVEGGGRTYEIRYAFFRERRHLTKNSVPPPLRLFELKSVNRVDAFVRVIKTKEGKKSTPL